MTATATGSERTGTVLRHTVKRDRPALATRTAIKRNAAGHDLGTVDLEPTVFGLEPNRAVLHQVVTAQLAAARAGTQSTKTRAEVRGGGAKPFRQKGTGRARQGSSRSPSMSGGGVALGPKPRSYAQRTPKKMVRLALLSALSDRAEVGRIAVIDDWEITGPKTKDAATILRKLRLGGSVLVVLAHDEVEVERSFANLPEAETTTFGELSAHDVLRADWLLFSERTLPAAASDFSGTHVVGEVKAADAEKPAEAAPRRRRRRRQRPRRSRRRPRTAGRRPTRPRRSWRRPSARRRVTKRAKAVPEAEAGAEATRRVPRPRAGARRVTPMRDAMSVLIRPVVSEKSYALMDRSVYVFIVDPRATKIEVRHAVEQAFGVRVTNVNTLNRKGKATRNRRTNVKGKRPDTKRAIVTLHPDDSIDLFDR